MYLHNNNRTVTNEVEMRNELDRDGLHIVYNEGYLTAHLHLRTNNITEDEVHNINNFMYQAVNAFKEKEEPKQTEQ
jgi:hypothetical protein